jgi:DNA-binding NarL/FixJ family response regulator
MAKQSRLVLADDHPVVLAGLHGLLKGAGLFEVLTIASNGAAALESIRELVPEIAVLDITMPEMTGIDVLRAVEAEQLATRVVLLTASVKDEQIASAVRHGVWGIVLKDAAADELITCLHQVAAGRRWLPTEIVDAALQRDDARQAENAKYDAVLTSREREIAILVARGMPNKVISRETGISEGTVKIHLHNVYQKLNVANRTALATIAQRYWGIEPG